MNGVVLYSSRPVEMKSFKKPHQNDVNSNIDASMSKHDNILVYYNRIVLQTILITRVICRKLYKFLTNFSWVRHL